MKSSLKWFITIAFIVVLINSYFTLTEFFTDEKFEDSESAGYFKKTDYGGESSKNLNITNTKNRKTITRGKNNIKKSQALLKKVNQVL